MESLTSTPQPSLSHELRTVINQRNILTEKSKSKVLEALDQQIEETKRNQLKLRNKAIDEIFSSEVSYLHQLELIVKYFKVPLDSSELMTAPLRRLLFGNVESIYQVNGELVNQLKIQGSNVGAAFSYLAPFFKLYSMYAYGYKTSLTVLQDAIKHNNNLRLWLKSQERRPEVATTLSALLIAPIQRLPRYRLLLRQLINLTPPTHPDHSILIKAVKAVEKAILCIDHVVLEQQKQARLVKLQQCFMNSNPSIVGPNKTLLKEGILMKMSKNGQKAQKRYFILLNDSIVYCKLSGNLRNQLPEDPGCLQCHTILPINKCSVQAVLGEAVFSLTCRSETYILFSDHRENSLNWISRIQEAISEHEKNTKTLRRKSSSHNTFHLNRKRKFTSCINTTNEENGFETPSKKAMYHQSIQEESSKTSYLQNIKSFFQSFGNAIRQYVYPGLASR